MEVKDTPLEMAIVRCKKCNDVIISLYTHDFKFCSCETCFVDGGFDYYRIGGKPEDYELTIKKVKSVSEARRIAHQVIGDKNEG